jgi:hypothetical protein
LSASGEHLNPGRRLTVQINEFNDLCDKASGVDPRTFGIYQIDPRSVILGSGIFSSFLSLVILALVFDGLSHVAGKIAEMFAGLGWSVSKSSIVIVVLILVPSILFIGSFALERHVTRRRCQALPRDLRSLLDALERFEREFERSYPMLAETLGTLRSNAAQAFVSAKRLRIVLLLKLCRKLLCQPEVNELCRDDSRVELSRQHFDSALAVCEGNYLERLTK